MNSLLEARTRVIIGLMIVSVLVVMNFIMIMIIIVVGELHRTGDGLRKINRYKNRSQKIRVS